MKRFISPTAGYISITHIEFAYCKRGHSPGPIRNSGAIISHKFMEVNSLLDFQIGDSFSRSPLCITTWKVSISVFLTLTVHHYIHQISGPPSDMNKPLSQKNFNATDIFPDICPLYPISIHHHSHILNNHDHELLVCMWPGMVHEQEAIVRFRYQGRYCKCLRSLHSCLNGFSVPGSFVGGNLPWNRCCMPGPGHQCHSQPFVFSQFQNHQKVTLNYVVLYSLGRGPKLSPLNHAYTFFLITVLAL